MFSLQQAIAKHGKQAALARELGVSRSAITLWKSGLRMPGKDVLPKLEKILNMTVDARKYVETGAIMFKRRSK
jgi:transcriptional regulator with XRE-family HTH domain